VVWAAVRDELRRPDPDMVSQISERLAAIGELLRGAALDEAAGMAPRAPGMAPMAPGMAPRAPAATPVATAAPAAEPRATWPSEPARPTAGEPLWVGALEDEIRRAAGGPLSLLLAELEDADRVLAAQPPSEASEAFGRFAAAVRTVVRRQDILVSESEARAWIIARDTGRGGAHALGERIADAVREADTWHGVPLNASVGVAILGEDGRTSGELIEAAEEARFAAAASGLRVLPGQRSEDEEPPGVS
jgi:GGDEF domain-containing protein